MKRKIAITINILGIICVFMPYIIVWLGAGDCRGSIAVIGGCESPAQLTLFANITSQGMILTSISTCIFVFNILAFWRKPKN
jgi:hypothetical protein